MERAPNFVVNWEPRWHGFCSSFKPVFTRSEEPLSIECAQPAGTPRSFAASVVLHVVAVIAVSALWPLLGGIGHVPLEIKSIDDYQVVYYRSDEFPIVADESGAREGDSGTSGGREAYHPTQVIRVARGDSPSSLVASVPPSMKLQLSTKDLANLLVLARALPEGPKAAPVPPKPEPLKVETMTGQKKLVAPKPVAAPGFQQFAKTIDRDPKLVLPTSPNVKLTPTINTESAQVDAALPSVNEHVPESTMNAPASSLVAKGGGGDSQNGADGDAIETAVVMSVRPGTTLGAPGVNIDGAFTASPNGRAEIGLGSGGGAGSGAGTGNGNGAGTHGDGPGSGTTGRGLGSDPTAVAGISPGTGRGGAGTGPAGAPRSGAGVSISGGSGNGNGNVVMLPSFSAKSAPSFPPRGRNDVGGPAIIIVAAPRAGGGLSRYGELKGSKVYTTYLKTSLGTAILQYADPTTKEGDFSEELSAPEPVKTDIPQDVKVGRMVISCVINKAGMLEKPKVVEGPQPEMTAKLLESLSTWRFRPVVRGSRKVDVDVLLGFKIDTR